MDQAGLFKAVKYFGSRHKLARAIGVTRQVVNYWLNHAQNIPFLQAVRIVVVSEGYINFHDLVPNFTAIQKNLEQAIIYQHFPAIALPIQKIRIQQRCSIYQNEFVFDDAQAFAQSRPLLVDSHYQLMTCECRLRAHQQAGHTTILVHPISLPEVLQGKKSLDPLLAQFPLSEKIAIGRALEQVMGNHRSHFAPRCLCTHRVLISISSPFAREYSRKTCVSAGLGRHDSSLFSWVVGECGSRRLGN